MINVNGWVVGGVVAAATAAATYFGWKAGKEEGAKLLNCGLLDNKGYTRPDGSAAGDWGFLNDEEEELYPDFDKKDTSGKPAPEAAPAAEAAEEASEPKPAVGYVDIVGYTIPVSELAAFNAEDLVVATAELEVENLIKNFNADESAQQSLKDLPEEGIDQIIDSLRLGMHISKHKGVQISEEEIEARLSAFGKVVIERHAEVNKPEPQPKATPKVADTIKDSMASRRKPAARKATKPTTQKETA